MFHPYHSSKAHLPQQEVRFFGLLGGAVAAAGVDDGRSDIAFVNQKNAQGGIGFYRKVRDPA